MKDPRQLSEELGHQLCQVVSGEGELVSKWIAVAEVIGSDGRRWLRTFWPDGAVPWDNVGMLSFALDEQGWAEMADPTDVDDDA